MARWMRDSRFLGNVVRLWVAAVLLGCGDGDEVARAPTPTAELGKKRFEIYCAACHQLAGVGIQGRVPPLDGSPWVAGAEERMIRIVLHGLRGPIEIAGETYNMEMPGFGQLFGDEDIASLLSYVRQRYGAPSPPVTKTTVRQVRAATRKRTEYWTVAELLEVP